MATILRELIARIKLDSKAALAGLKKYDKLLDETKKKTEGVTDETKAFGDETEKTAKKAARAAKKTSKSWKEIGKSVKSAGAQVKGAGASITAGLAVVTTATAAASAGIFEFTKTWAESTNEISRRSGQLGVAADDLQQLRTLAKLTGVEAESIDDALKEVQVRAGEAALTSSGAFADAAEILKLNSKELARLSPVELFEKLRKELSAVENQAKRTFLSEELLGEGGVLLGNIINLTEEDFQGLKFEAKELGGVLGKDALGAAKAFGEELTRTEIVVGSVKSSVAEELAPTIQGLVGDFRQWLIENKDLVKGKLVSFLKQVIAAARRLAPFVLKLLNLFIKINDASGGLVSSLKLLGGAFVALQLAALGPIGAIAAGIVGLITLLDNYIDRVNAAAKAQDDLADETGVSKNDRRLLAQSGAGQNILDELDATQEGINAKTKEINRLREIKDDPTTPVSQLSSIDELGNLNLNSIPAQLKRAEAFRDEAIARRRKFLTEADPLIKNQAELEDVLKRTSDVVKANIRGDELEGLTKKKKKKKKKKEKASDPASLGELLGFGKAGFDVPGTTRKGLGTTLVNITFNMDLPSVNVNVEAAPGATVRSQGKAAADAIAGILPSVVKQTQRAAVGQIR